MHNSLFWIFFLGMGVLSAWVPSSTACAALERCGVAASVEPQRADFIGQTPAGAEVVVDDERGGGRVPDVSAAGHLPHERCRGDGVHASSCDPGAVSPRDTWRNSTAGGIAQQVLG